MLEAKERFINLVDNGLLVMTATIHEIIKSYPQNMEFIDKYLENKAKSLENE